jgi:transposase
MQQVTPYLTVLESTGGYERQVTLALNEANIRVAVVNARQVRDFSKSTGQLAKTDRIDAGMIAWYGEAIAPEPRPLADEAGRHRAALATRRRQLVKMLATEKNHLSTAPIEIAEMIREQIAHLQRCIDEVEQQMQEAVRADPRTAALDKLLQTMKGIGTATSGVLVAHLPELGQLTRRQIAKLVGVAPLNHDSGQHTGKRSCWGGRGEVRSALYLPTLTAVRFNPVIRDLYTRLKAKGKLHKVAMIACMRKMLTILNAMVRDETIWDATHPVHA